MIARALTSAAIATAFALTPATGVLANTPNVNDLPKALADPVEQAFVEVEEKATGYLEGFFDASNYARSQTRDTNTRSDINDALATRGFVIGYEREFYIPKAPDWLIETVLVFDTPAGARGFGQQDKIIYSRARGFEGYLDTKLGPDAWGLKVTSNGYHWILIEFTKGNDLFVMWRGAVPAYSTDKSIEQAQKMYAQAPNGTQVRPPSPASKSPVVSFWRQAAPIAMVAALILGLLIASVVFVVLRTNPPRQVN